MKKILLSLAVIAIVAVGAIGATRAYFSDTATISGNTFTSGTMALKIDGNESSAAYTWTDGFDSGKHFNNLKPGDLGEQIIDIKNVGGIDGFATLKFTTSDTDVLISKLNISVTADMDHNGTFEKIVATGPLSAWLPNTYDLGKIISGLTTDGTDNTENSGKIASVKINWNVPTEVGNEIQGNDMTVGITFNLEQNHVTE